MTRERLLHFRAFLRQIRRLAWAPSWWGLRGAGSSGVHRDDGLEISTTVDCNGPDAVPRWYVYVAEGCLFDHVQELMGEDTVWLDARTVGEAIAEVDRRWPYPGGLLRVTWSTSAPEIPEG